MRGTKVAISLLFAALAVSVLTATAALRSQDGSNPQVRNEEKRQELSSELPVTAYDASEPPDPEARIKRHIKSRKYDKSPFNVTLLLTNKETTAVTDWEMGLVSALPTSQSRAVLLGEVVNAQAHLSDDKTGVYSEFVLRVEDILKNDRAAPLTVGDLVGAERPGGRVRAPSGHVHPFRVSGQGTPRVGRRYIFFLGPNPREEANSPASGDMSRNILTGYELRAGKVSPLDDAGGKNFQSYRGMDEAAFLNEVRRAIANGM